MPPLEIVCFTNRGGSTYARGSNRNGRVFLDPGRWPDLSLVQKDALCRLIWAVQIGRFRITEHMIGTGEKESWEHIVNAPA